jgi:hypothetical protein
VTHSGQAIPRLTAVSDTASLDPARLLPPVLGADDTDTPADIVDALALASFTARTQPYAVTIRLSEVRPGAPLLPPGATVLRRAAEPDRDACWPRDRWTIRVVAGTARRGWSVTAVAEELARSVQPRRPGRRPGLG